MKGMVEEGMVGAGVGNGEVLDDLFRTVRTPYEELMQDFYTGFYL